MKSIKEFSKEWCCEHSNKGCKEQCEGCWQIKSAWGCGQHNMELAYEAGANYVLGQVEILLNSQRFVDNPSQELYELIEQLKK